MSLILNTSFISGNIATAMQLEKSIVLKIKHIQTNLTYSINSLQWQT